MFRFPHATVVTKKSVTPDDLVTVLTFDKGCETGEWKLIQPHRYDDEGQSNEIFHSSVIAFKELRSIFGIPEVRPCEV